MVTPKDFIRSTASKVSEPPCTANSDPQEIAAHRFHLNGHTLGFHPQPQHLAQHNNGENMLTPYNNKPIRSECSVMKLYL